MCSILTVSKQFWDTSSIEVIDRIERDSLVNSDGFALLALDSCLEHLNVRLQSMNIQVILTVMQDFFNQCSEYGRVFLHSRMATTGYVGIAYNHGFDNFRGKVIMHNGILSHGRNYTVDSFALVQAPLDTAETLMEYLIDRNENYANIFVVDTELYTYSMVRSLTGSLYTDGEGNYSTNQLADICQPVDVLSYEDHDMPLPPKAQVSYIADYQDYLDTADQEYLDESDSLYLDNWSKYRIK